MDIFIPILILTSLGAVFGVGLALASKKFAVRSDPRLDKILGLLPGSNCGACGGAGCFGFVESVLSGKLGVDACRVSGEEVKAEIARLLGRKLEQKVKKVALPRCNGGAKVKERFIYRGIKTCAAANLVLGGQKACVFGCLGFGDCVRACPFGAIKIPRENLPVVDEKKCKACNKCVAACPKKLFTLAPVTGKVYVACGSHDAGKDTREVCPVGCIACGLCQKACKFDAIHVLDNLAVIDYQKCTSCGECARVCPMKTIRIKQGG
ncbi:MAG: RnfABCDGE type electron transport complex subunit B [Candidatus Omnitrophota bacterium]|nr:RnfABCDGE type electron transport complex subunit B [Candidatus Omnitrophota bacterium]